MKCLKCGSYNIALVPNVTFDKNGRHEKSYPECDDCGSNLIETIIETIIETKIIEKYRGAYLKNFQTKKEMEKYIDEHYEIMEMYIKDENGKWKQI